MHRPVLITATCHTRRAGAYLAHAHAIYTFARQRSLHQTAVATDSRMRHRSGCTYRLFCWRWRIRTASFPGSGRSPTTAGIFHWTKITDVAPVHRLAKAVAIVPVGMTFRRSQPTRAGTRRQQIVPVDVDLAFQSKSNSARWTRAAAYPPYRHRSRSGGAIHRASAATSPAVGHPAGAAIHRLPSRARVVMCAGLPAVWQYSRGTHANVANAPTGLPPMHSCQVINHTPAGYALRQIDTSKHPAHRRPDRIAG